LAKHLEKMQSVEVDRIALCIAGRNPLDEACATILAQLLEQKKCRAKVVPSRDVSTTSLIKLDPSNVSTAYVCYLDPNSFTNARFMIRRLRRQVPAARVIVGPWSLSERDIAEAGDAVQNIGADLVVNSLRQAVEEVGLLSVGTLDQIAPIEGTLELAAFAKS
jgi:hypothetical protein